MWGGAGDARGMAEGVVVAIETSTGEGSLAAWRGGAVVHEESFAGGRGHNSALFGPLGRALAALGGAVPARVLVGTGPGSYSGTRVGIAAAHGVGVVSGCPVTGVPSLLATPEARAGAPSLAVGDARRGAWWTARVAADGTISGPDLCDAAALEARVAAAQAAGEPVVAFDPPERLGVAAPLRARVAGARPSAQGLLAAWLGMGEDQRRRMAAVPAEPCYLRPAHVTLAKPGHPLFRDR